MRKVSLFVSGVCAPPAGLQKLSQIPLLKLGISAATPQRLGPSFDRIKGFPLDAIPELRYTHNHK